MNADYTLCNLLLADGERFEEHPGLYVRETPCVRADEDGAVRLDPAAVRYDFATYLNAFSYAKWCRYTTIENVWLHLRARGSFTVVYTGYDQVLQKPRRRVFERRSYAFEDYADLEFCYPASDCVIVAFEIETSHALDVAEAWYYTKVDAAQLRDVELAVCTTTFRKEDYILSNIRLFEEQILGSSEPVAEHFTLHVVDNGSTLDAVSLTRGRVHVHPSPNVGGAGGFSRGMIEAMEQEPSATHVLLMDDDVQIHPEAIKRTYNLLRLLKDEYAGHFISGAMLCLEDPTKFHEDIGFVGGIGGYRSVKNPMGKKYALDVRDLACCLDLETAGPQVHNRYAAWWYCCIPVERIRRFGLALPVFIRGDDAEYGNRAAEGFITMNGICIWHLSNAGVFNAALERYYQLRNALIAQAASGIYKGVDFLALLNHFLGIDLKTFNYNAAELCLKGFEDFMLGPDHLVALPTARTHAELARYNERLLPLSEIDDPAVQGLDVIPGELPVQYEERGFVQKAYDFATFNGQRGPARLAPGGTAVIAYDGWFYPANAIRGKDAVLAVTIDGTRGVLRRKDRARFDALMKRYERDLREYRKNREEIDGAWRSARQEICSVAFWKRYLAAQTSASE